MLVLFRSTILPALYRASLEALPNLDARRIGAAMVSTIKMELRPPTQWVQVGRTGLSYPVARNWIRSLLIIDL